MGQAGRMFSAFDDLVVRMQFFDVQETAKFDMLCCVVDFIVRENDCMLYRSICMI
jgi:hypothetical protein